MVTITGSHRNFCIFGAISLEGKQLFRQFERFNEDTFYEFLKQIHYKFPKCYLFLDKAPQHHKSRKVRKYFEEHKDTLIPIYLPTASPEFMVLEECWNISKNDLLVLRGELLENLIKSNRPEKKIHEWEQSATEARKIIARTTLPNAEAIVFDPLMGTWCILGSQHSNSEEE